MKAKIFYTKPSITELEVDYATDAARNGWGEHCYDYIHRFEGAFSKHLGVKHAIATSSCTGALHMGLAALDIGPGDEVILADTNWIATAAPIVHLGAKPIFVDILADSWCIDPTCVEKAISPRTKAIIATHLYGNLCDLDSLLAIGRKKGIPVIEDAAEAIGSVYRNQRAGSCGAFGAFSFHGSKTITTGEGGMFVTNDSALYNRVLTIANHGRAPGQTKQFWADVVGHKYKISNLQAAIGCAQLERIDSLLPRKREILAYYRNNLEKLGFVRMNTEPPYTINGAWMPTAVFSVDSNITRDKISSSFRDENIDARVFFYPLSSLPPFSPCTSNRVAYDLPTRAINLPSYHDITTSEQDRVIAVIANAASNANQS